MPLEGGNELFLGQEVLQRKIPEKSFSSPDPNHHN